MIPGARVFAPGKWAIVAAAREDFAMNEAGRDRLLAILTQAVLTLLQHEREGTCIDPDDSIALRRALTQAARAHPTDTQELEPELALDQLFERLHHLGPHVGGSANRG
jgi:hypothetical protein